MKELHSRLVSTLQEKFGLQEFRKGQLEAITLLMTQGHLLSILPTGYGKSLLYQLPAVILDGITLVISPLLALMRDQIYHLNHRFNIPAMAINSDQSVEENDRVRNAAFQGKIKILFIAPEQLDHVDRFQFFMNLNIKLLVVDEAHCISTWGHDFRPSYRQILHFLHAVQSKNKDVKILGLTATANKRVEEDIHKQLFLPGQEGSVLRQSMDRPNIALSVTVLKGIAEKLTLCEQLLKGLEGCGLIYCATRENTEIAAEYLQKQGCNVTSYHAGYQAEAKKKLQQEFVQDKYKALIATNALGMGIDKGNLRFIIHFDLPGSITAYYQEVGRCGRDGLPAKGFLLYDSSDCRIHDYFIHSALPTPEDFQLILNAVALAKTPPGLVAIKTLTGLHPTMVTNVIAELVEQGHLEKYSLSGKQVYRLLPKKSSPDLSRYQIQHKVKKHELKQIARYGEQTAQCRMLILRKALGDEEARECLRCDFCLKKSPVQPSSVNKVEVVRSWIDKRPVIIPHMGKEQVAEGLSILDGKMRSPLFTRFMKQRACCPEGTCGMDEELMEMIKHQLGIVLKKEKNAGLLMMPSRTWQARDKIAFHLGNSFQIPVYNLLEWREIPPKRQGELLNNDQRRDNVKGRMQAVSSVKIHAAETFILLDDYIGSGATIKEAARSLHASGFNNKLIPITIAAVKWHLGKPGFI